MSDPILSSLVVILTALPVLGLAGGRARGRVRRAMGVATAALGGITAILALSVLLLGHAADLVLPVGPPGLALHLALDPLSGFFLLWVGIAGTAGLAFTQAAEPPGTQAGLALGLAGLILALLAADAVALALGIAISGGAIWMMGREDRARPLGVTLLAASALFVALALLAPGDSGGRFAAIRAVTVDPARAAWVLALALLGPGALAGLAPFHAWLAPAHRAIPVRAASLLSGAVVPVAAYCLIRLLIDLSGPAPSPWWGLPLLAMGAASALAGGWRAGSEPDLESALAALTGRQSGLVAIGLGLAVIAKAADLPEPAALALAAVLLLSAAQAVCVPLVLLAAGAVAQGAGTRRLDRLGGLIHRMPVVTAAMLAGLFGLAALPCGVGFAGLWLLFHAVLAAPRAGGLAPQILFALVAAVLALSAALAAVALVRLIGVAFLGRPRTPRAAAADDAAGAARPVLLGLAALSLLLGVFPGIVLRLLADPVIRSLTGIDLGPRAGVLAITPSVAAPGYTALPLAALIGLAGGMAFWLLRRRAAPPERVGPAWNDGFAPPPPWLPFGDPVTQSAGAGFLPALPRLAASGLPRQWWLASGRLAAGRWRVQSAGTWAMLGLVGVVLVVLALVMPT